MAPDRLHALMTVAIATWENGRARPYDVEEITLLDLEHAEYMRLPLTLRRALGCRMSGDLEWTVLIVPALTVMLDEATAGFGGTWPVQAVTGAVASRALAVEHHADSWAAGSEVTGPPLLELLAATRVAHCE